MLLTNYILFYYLCNRIDGKTNFHQFYYNKNTIGVRELMHPN